MLRKLNILLQKFLAVHIGYSLVYLLSRSLRYQIIGVEQLEQFRDKNGFIMLGWHNQQLVGFYVFRNKGYRGLSSLSRDGDITTALMNKFGWNPPIRGSSSKKSTRSLIELIRVLKDKSGVVLTPDGPRGPLHKVQPGSLYAAQKTGCPLIPIAIIFDRKWVLEKTWDKFVIPKPFARCVLYVGKPIFIEDKKLTEAELISETTRVEHAIHESNRLAEAALTSAD